MSDVNTGGATDAGVADGAGAVDGTNTGGVADAGVAVDSQGTGQADVSIDLSGLMSADNPEIFDTAKVTELYQSTEKLKADKSFFQTKYQEKTGVPEKIEDYGSKFKSDSVYEKFLQQDEVKDMQSKLYEHAKENGVGVDAANSMFDFIMKTAVESGDLDGRSEEQIQAEVVAAETAMTESLQPMLEASNRTREDQDAIHSSFFKGKNAFTNDPQVKELLEVGSKENPIFYKITALINDIFTMGNVPKVTGTVQAKDKAAFQKAFNAEPNPELRDAMLKEFEGAGK